MLDNPTMPRDEDNFNTNDLLHADASKGAKTRREPGRSKNPRSSSCTTADNNGRVRVVAANRFAGHHRSSPLAPWKRVALGNTGVCRSCADPYKCPSFQVLVDSRVRYKVRRTVAPASLTEAAFP